MLNKFCTATTDDKRALKEHIARLEEEQAVFCRKIALLNSPDLTPALLAIICEDIPLKPPSFEEVAERQRFIRMVQGRYEIKVAMLDKQRKELRRERWRLRFRCFPCLSLA